MLIQNNWVAVFKIAEKGWKLGLKVSFIYLKIVSNTLILKRKFSWNSFAFERKSGDTEQMRITNTKGGRVSNYREPQHTVDKVVSLTLFVFVMWFDDDPWFAYF